MTGFSYPLLAGIVLAVVIAVCFGWRTNEKRYWVFLVGMTSFVYLIKAA